MARVMLMVGLPGSGKTTRARTLAGSHNALRLTPDEWMIPLFGEPDAEGKRDIVEGCLISLAVQLVRLGTNVILDFGCWGRDERSSLRWLFETEGAEFELVYLPVDRADQIKRIRRRWLRAPQVTFPITMSELDDWRAVFEVPDATELAGSPPPGPPAGWATWLAWAKDRWPSLSTD